MTQNNKKNEDPQTPNFPKFVQKSQKRNKYTQEQRRRLFFDDDEEEKTKNYTIRVQYCTKGNRRLIRKQEINTLRCRYKTCIRIILSK
jgi:hypothetical protein